MYLVLKAQIFTDSDEHATQYRYYADESNNSVAVAATATSWNIIALKYTSVASCTQYINGGAGSTFNAHDDYSTTTELYLGANSSGATPGDYDIGRVLVYSGALSDADLNYLISGLGSLWNITVTPVS
jgi:hypothetical protein